MAYTVVFLPSEIEMVEKVSDEKSKKAKNGSAEINTLRAIRKKCRDAIATQDRRQSATKLEGEVLKRNQKVVPWKKLFFSLERKLGFDILAVRLNVPSYIAKSLSSGLVTPSVDLQERILNLSAIVAGKTVNEVLNV